MYDYWGNYLIQIRKSNVIMQNCHIQMCVNDVMSKRIRFLPKDTYHHLKVVEAFQTYTTIDWIWQMILKTKLLFCLVTTRTFSNCTDHLFSQPPHTSKTRKNTFEIIILHIITTFLAVFKALYIVLWSWLNRLFSKLHFLSSEVTAWTSGNSTDIC